MEDNLNFNDINELYDRIKPALNSKVEELHKLRYIYIKGEDIFDFLRINKWVNSSNLCLAQIVDDVLNVDIDKLDKYVQNKVIEKIK